MLVILEGPDGSGKTTLSRAIAELLLRDDPRCVVDVLHRGPPTQHPLDEYLRPLTRYRPGTKQHLILDRWHWGEWVYPHVRNRPTQLDVASWRAIEDLLERLGAIVVLCTQYHDEYKRVFAERGDPLSELDELPEVERYYLRARLQSILPNLTFNWSSPVNGDLFSIVARALERDEIAASLRPHSITYTGPRRPTYLLLGDIRHKYDWEKMIPSDPLFWDPAFVPFPRTSGSYLRGALETHFAPNVIGIANACDVDDPYALWEALERPPTVALGRRAQSKCRSLGITDAVVPHPQYVRRFHYAKQYEYGRLIAQALQDRGDYGAWPSSLKPRPVRTLTSRSSTGFAVQDDAVRVATV